MKILKSKKALSPVVASIILIAVTVAVSIAVAAWMGALTFTFMGTEQLDIRNISWYGPNAGFNLTVYNTGTAPVTVTQIWVNNVDKTSSSNIGSGISISEGGSGQINVNSPYTNGTSYEITIVTSKGNRFSKTYVGGTPG
jgi:flagellin-like protein